MLQKHILKIYRVCVWLTIIIVFVMRSTACLASTRQGQESLDLFAQRTNLSQAERARVFSHAQSVGAHTLTLTDHTDACFLPQSAPHYAFFLKKKKKTIE